MSARTAALWMSTILFARTAWAWDPATTHAGLTERAALASSLPRVLKERFGLMLGAYQPLHFEARDERGRALLGRLERLDPAAGYAPVRGRMAALGWLVAGAVIEEVPPARGRNHFYDPSTKRGLEQGGLGVRLAGVGSGLGWGFDGTGLAATAWLTATDNDLNLARFLDAAERAVTAAAPAERQSSLAEALLVAGALVHVVEDAGEPAHAHGDFRVDLHDGGAPFINWVAARWDRLSSPAPSGPARPVAHLAELIAAGDGSGLADRTARRFYSLGLLPGGDAAAAKRAAAAGLPALVAGTEDRGYVLGDKGIHVAHWVRDSRGRVLWDLDERCYVDYAAALLPETTQAALSALEHLLRGNLSLASGAVRSSGPLGAGRVTLLVENAVGERKPIANRDLKAVAAGEPLVEYSPTEIAGARRLAAVFRGVDAAGEPIVASGEIEVP